MSYTVFIGKFKDGEPAKIAVDDIKNGFSKYGSIRETSSEIELIADRDLFESGTFTKDNFSQLSLHRPSIDQEFKNFVFDFLQIDGTCYFSQDLDFIKTRSGEIKNFPRDMIEHCVTGITVVTSPEDL
ncbi:hypothetical protein [Dokdonia donghaensis]|uniref:Uncharacterized protein n=1 Tax=Dokdonia donghaensis DSW-1 TaxID=1300343 RepID=A0A0A2GUR8_9FLAO|nr:hypothetical protein [Dokdonia donghaensis]ANH61667.1 hypothetical protein I597_2776 [Dokdonia donghaensis DSW-1]KGO06258.1 hypothetical protein NV36_05020 [Dokdonia donghaensis DSW-1]